MIDSNRYNNYIEVVESRKSIYLLSTIFFLILTVLIISYVCIDSSISNITTMAFIIVCELLSMYKLITNGIKLSNLKSNKNKYISA